MDKSIYLEIWYQWCHWLWRFFLSVVRVQTRH